MTSSLVLTDCFVNGNSSISAATGLTSGAKPSAHSGSQESGFGDYQESNTCLTAPCAWTHIRASEEIQVRNSPKCTPKIVAILLAICISRAAPPGRGAGATANIYSSYLVPPRNPLNITCPRRSTSATFLTYTGEPSVQGWLELQPWSAHQKPTLRDRDDAHAALYCESQAPRSTFQLSDMKDQEYFWRIAEKCMFLLLNVIYPPLPAWIKLTSSFLLLNSGFFPLVELTWVLSAISLRVLQTVSALALI